MGNDKDPCFRCHSAIHSGPQCLDRRLMPERSPHLHGPARHQHFNQSRRKRIRSQHAPQKLGTHWPRLRRLTRCQKKIWIASKPDGSGHKGNQYKNAEVTLLSQGLTATSCVDGPTVPARSSDTRRNSILGVAYYATYAKTGESKWQAPGGHCSIFVLVNHRVLPTWRYGVGPILGPAWKLP